jgi:hypothetical protein
MERVSIQYGKKPILFIAPHGNTDTNTDIITEAAASALNAYYVINRGWKRASQYDYYKEHANCNNISHLHEDVVKEEFLDPILRFKNKIRKKHNYAHIFIIHGMGNDIRKLSGDSKLGLIIGHGAGSPDSLSCKEWMKNLFAYTINEVGMMNWTAYEGRAGGQYAGWAKNNLNQLFRKWHYDGNVFSMQLEFVYDIRKTKSEAEVLGEFLAMAIEEVSTYGHWDTPYSFKVKKF